MPVTKAGVVLATSASRKTMTSPSEAASAAAMAWPLPPSAAWPSTTRAPASWACSAVSSVEESLSTMTSSTRPFPPAEARKGWTTARTTEPTVDPSSRAGMQTETVRSPLASRTRAAGNSPW